MKIYPFWFTFFTNLGFRVVLSDPSSKSLYEKGMDTISSDTACYPAKLVHGHIRNLVSKGVKWIFYPSINYEMQEDEAAPNHYNCPVVATYPEVIGANMDEIFEEHGVTFSHPFLPYDNDQALTRELHILLRHLNISMLEINKSIKAGRAEDKRFKDDVKNRELMQLSISTATTKKPLFLQGDLTTWIRKSTTESIRSSLVPIWPF
jgi:Uncharacterized protein conserved in bacteria